MAEGMTAERQVKAPEQLKKQLDLVNIQSSLLRYPDQIQADGHLFSIGSEELNSILNKERDKINFGGEHSELLDAYNSYLKSLRDIRRKQKDQTSQIFEQPVSRNSLRENYLRNVNFSSALQDSILKRLNKQDYSHPKGLFTEEEIASGRESEEKFLQVVESGLERAPDLIFRSLDALKYYLDPEKIKHFINQSVEKGDYALFFHPDQAKKFYSPAEFKALISQAISADSFGNRVLGSFYNPDLYQFFTPEEGRNIVLQAISVCLTGSSAPESSEIMRLHTAGLLTDADVKSTVINFIRKMHTGVGLIADEIDDSAYRDRPPSRIPGRDTARKPVIKEGSLLRYFSPQERGLLVQEVITSFTRLENTSYLSDLSKLTHVLSKDQQVFIVRTLMRQQPAEAVRNISSVEHYLAQEEIQSFIKDIAEGKHPDIFRLGFYSAESLLESKLIDIDARKKIVNRYLETNPDRFFSNINLFFEGQTEAERRNMVAGLVKKARSPEVISSVEEWIEFITNDRIEQKNILKKVILNQYGFRFLTAYLDNNGLLKQLYPPEEMEGLLFQKVESGAEDAFYNLESISKILGEDKLKNFALKVKAVDSPHFFCNIGKVETLFGTEEIIEFVNEGSKNPDNTYGLIMSIEDWAPLLGNDYTWNFLQMAALMEPTEVTWRLSECLAFVPENEKGDFLFNLIKINPALAIEERESRYKPHLPDLTEDQILELAKSDLVRSDFAPRTLAEFFKNITKVKDTESRNAILTEAKEIYYYISRIQIEGLGDEYRRIKASDPTTDRKEKELVSLFYCLTILRKADPGVIDRMGGLGESLDDVNQKLFRELENRMGLNREILPEERTRFIGAMGTLVPFMTYFLRFESSDSHRRVLINIFQSLLDGKYRNWKFGPETIESLSSLQEARLMPKGFNIEQFSVWRQDEQTTLHESLSTDALMVASSIQQILLENNEHLQIEALSGLGINLREAAKQTQERLNTVGQELSGINKKLVELRKASNGSVNEEIIKLEGSKKDFEERRRTYLRNKIFIRLATLKPEEIVSGYLLEGGDLKRRGQPIADVLKEIKEKGLIPEDSLFIIENIGKQLTSFYNQSGEKQNLFCVDSSDPKVTLEIGINPVSSCQNYAHGSHNDCLLGYTEANTKILVLRNEKGNLVARAIFRLLSDNNSNPALHIERVYSTTGSEGVLRSIYSHAFKKAQTMGLPLYVSQASQDAGGVESGIRVPTGFTLVPREMSLVSKASRAPKVYVDSAGGAKSSGEYTMNNLLEIQLAA